MAVLELAGMVASLAADWLTTRKDDAESKDTAAFQRWLHDEAFPRMEAQAERALLSTVRLRVEQRDQFDQLVAHLLAIKKLLGATTAADVWRELSDDERALLNAAYDDHALPDGDQFACPRALRETLGYEPFRSAARSEVHVSLTICAFILGAWKAAGDLETQSMYPVERSRVTGVKESLRRRYAQD